MDGSIENNASLSPIKAETVLEVAGRASDHRLDATKRLCGVSSTMDWAEVEMELLSLILGSPLRLLPTTSIERYIAVIRSSTDGAQPPVFRDISTSDRLSAFVPVTTDVVCTLVRNAADNTQ